MKRSKLLTVLAASCVLAASVSTAAFADDEKKERHWRGVYGGIGIGGAFFEEQNVPAVGGPLDGTIVNFDGAQNLSWKFAAWIRPFKYMGLELGYFNLRDNTLGLKNDGFLLNGLGMYPIGPFDIYGKIGMSVATVSPSNTATYNFAPTVDDPTRYVINAESESTEVEPIYGGGVAYQWKNLGGRLEYERYNLDNAANTVWFILYYQLGKI